MNCIGLKILEKNRITVIKKRDFSQKFILIKVID